jgi:hypothetical protein
MMAFVKKDSGKLRKPSVKIASVLPETQRGDLLNTAPRGCPQTNVISDDGNGNNKIVPCFAFIKLNINSMREIVCF